MKSDNETFTVMLIYENGCSIVKRDLTTEDVDRIIKVQEDTNKFKKIIISNTTKN